MTDKEKAKAEARTTRVGGARSGYLNFRCSETARWIVEELQDQLGLSQGSVIEVLLREEARRRGMIIPGSGADRARRAAQEVAADRLRTAAADNPTGDVE